jgi:four helix bundle protein
MSSSNQANGMIPGRGSSESVRSVMFDHEKLDVYRLELQFIAWVALLIEEASKITSGRTGEIFDQLDRASLSSLLNTAEGNGKRQRQVRAKFFDDARGSATECAACLDALVAKKLVSIDRIIEGKRVLVRIVSILCKLVERFDSGSALHEEATAYRADGNGGPISYSLTTSRTRTRTTARTKEKL